MKKIDINAERYFSCNNFQLLRDKSSLKKYMIIDIDNLNNINDNSTTINQSSNQSITSKTSTRW